MLSIYSYYFGNKLHIYRLDQALPCQQVVVVPLAVYSGSVQQSMCHMCLYYYDSDGDNIPVNQLFIPDTLVSIMESEFSSSSSKRDRDSGSKDGPLGEQPDDELTIPRAAMNKMIKELLPNIRVANEARELVLNCCTEFIHLISSESNDICNQQQKKTISAEHVLVALEKLGYGDFRKDAEEAS